jgi:long-chain acyl-CoA synthetase
MSNQTQHYTVDVPSILSRLPDRIHKLVTERARETPDALALRDDARSWTYADLDNAMNAAAELLQQRGVRSGDRVMLINENCLELTALILAVSKLDAWSVLVNARLSAAEIDSIRDHATPRRVVYTAQVSQNAAAHAARHTASAFQPKGVDGLLIGEQLAAEPEPTQASSAEQVAAMIYTSGTTGKPKGVMLTHLNLLYVASVAGSQRKLNHSDRVYAVLPISHVFGLTAMFLGTLYAGGSLRVRSIFDAAHLANALAQEITVFMGVPTMYAKLLEYAETHAIRLSAPAIRYLSAGGSPLDLDLKRRVEKVFGTPLHNGYGLTETSPTVTQTPMDAPCDDDSVGLPVAGLEVRVVDRNGNDVERGTVGELWVRGKSVMKGYYRDPEQTAKALDKSGWFATGDLARQNDNGYLYVTGRLKELIIRSGFNVFPPEVEAALNTHPEVTLSAVVGRKVPGNEEVVAFVELVPEAHADETALKAYLRDLLAPYKLPTQVIIMQHLPASATGKIYKHKLSEMAANLSTP